jgi:dTDP-4-dehydrorhamnose reductase
MYLLLGGDSLIAKDFENYLINNNYPYLKTSRRNKKINKCIYLDLNTPFIDINSIPFFDIKCVFIFASVTSFLHNKDYPTSSFDINCTKISQIILMLSKFTKNFVYISSSSVFNGLKSYPSELDFSLPSSLYGFNKLQAELVLKHSSLFNNFNLAVVRPTKIITLNLPLIHQWFYNLKSNIAIQAATDKIFSPISSIYFSLFLHKLGLNFQSGTFHLSGKSDISYYEFASLLAGNLNKSLVIPTKIDPQNIYSFNNSLDMSNSSKFFNFLPQDVYSVLKDLNKQSFGNPPLLQGSQK